MDECKPLVHGLHPRGLHAGVNMPLMFGPLAVSAYLTLLGALIRTLVRVRGGGGDKCSGGSDGDSSGGGDGSGGGGGGGSSGGGGGGGGRGGGQSGGCTGGRAVARVGRFLGFRV